MNVATTSSSPIRRYFISSHEAILGAKWHVLWRQQVELISPANRPRDQYKEGVGNLKCIKYHRIGYPH